MEIEHNKIPESERVIYLDLPVEWTLKAIEKEARKIQTESRICTKATLSIYWTPRKLTG